MIDIRDRMTEEIQINKEIIGTFQLLQGDVEKTNDAIQQMEKRTERQVALIRAVDKNIQRISGAIKNIADRVSQSFDEIKNADNRVKELQKSTQTFKVD